MRSKNITLASLGAVAASVLLLFVYGIHLTGLAAGYPAFVYSLLSIFAFASAVFAAVSVFKLIRGFNMAEKAADTEPSGYKTLMESIPVPIVDLDSAGNISFLNGEARLLTGDLGTAKKPFAELVRPEGLTDFLNLLKNTIKADTALSLETVIRTESGIDKALKVNAAPVRGNAECAGFRLVLISKDAPGPVKLREELEKARRHSEEASAELRKTMKELEEFALIAIRRELKMQEIRTRLKRLKDGLDGRPDARPGGQA